MIGRFSLGGGLPDQPDKPDTVRGLGLLFQTPDGQQWRTAMINLPVFTDSTPQGFYERLLASKPQPDTGKPDPQKMAAFLDRHPETAAAMKIIKQSPPSAGFADSTFYGLNAFWFTNGAGATVPVRWSAVPTKSAAGPTPSAGKDYLFDDLIRAVAQRPLRWRLVLTIGEPGDPTNDATKPWPPSRRPSTPAPSPFPRCRPRRRQRPGHQLRPDGAAGGIALSDDPIPSARAAVYARSFNRRADEPKSPSEVPRPGALETTATSPATRFALPSRILHWLMAPMVIAQLFIGVTMVASLSYYPLLLAIHRPLGVMILIFAVIRLANRLTHKTAAVPGHHEPRRAPRRVLVGIPAVRPAARPAADRVGHAVGRPIPDRPGGAASICPASRRTTSMSSGAAAGHSVFAFLLFLAFTAHVCAVLFHTLVLRDRLLDRMAVWPTRPPPRP